MMLQPILLREDAWSSTFPCRVTPLVDEWLSGLLLRCDEMNHWPSGTTSAYLLRNSTYNASQSTYHTLVPPLWLLEELSDLLAVPLHLLHATTYLPELTHMYHLSKLPPSMLLNSSYFFHFCPECARNRLLRRVLMLAHITCCSLHGVALCHQCPCGTPQRLFCRQTHPFTCYSCGLDWARFPQCSVSPKEMSLSNELLKWYEVFFARGTPMLFSSALKLVRRRFPETGAGGVRLLDGKTRFALPDGRSQISLGHLVNWLVSLDLSPSDLSL
jgi:TniQ